MINVASLLNRRSLPTVLTCAASLLPQSLEAQESPPPDVTAPAAEPAPVEIPDTARTVVAASGERGLSIEDFDDLSIEDLLGTEVKVATKSAAKSLLDSPAIMTVLMHDEILRSGARDLVDILMLVPGFQTGTDTYGTVYAGFRGVWGAEGKILYMLNGHEMQENLYAMTPLGNHIPVDWIERVEIIRGPGSAIYGGAAELAVVNIVTHQPADFERAGIYGTYGQYLNSAVRGNDSVVDTYGRRNLALIAGHVFEGLDDLEVGAAAFVGQGQRTDRIYHDGYGDSLRMTGNSALNPLMVNTWAEWRGLKLNYLLDGYEGSFRDAFGPIVPALAHVGFLSSSLDLSYEWKPTDDWRVVPRLRQIFQQPWHTADEYYRPAEEQERTGLYWVPTMERYEGSATVSWSGIEALDLLGGASFTFDRAKDDVKGFADPDDPDATVSEVTYRNIAAFAEALWGTSLADLSIGARFENHSQFGSSFVPRLGLTKSLGSAHVKLLASQAFRAPTIQNLASTPSVTPERATVFEMEFGARLSEHVYFAANVFDSVAKDPIYYYYDDTFDGYRNGSRTGTRGIEIEGRFKLRSHFVNVAYSFYNAARKNEVDVFAVEENPNVLLGFSPHKLTVNSAFEVIDDLSLGASLVFLGGQRYAYTAVNTLGEARLQDLGPVLLLNAHVLYQNAFIRGLSVGLSACNLLNENAAFIQPYNNGHAPLPGTPLEVLLKVAYEMPLI